MVIDKQELLGRRFDIGTRVMNCLAHENRPIYDRPIDCKLCYADLCNHMALAIRLNKWLNEWKDDATTLLQVFNELSVEDK